MKSVLLLFTVLISLSSFSQHIIKGSISDAYDKLPYANIIIKHSNKGVFADDFGNFYLETKPSDTLQISYLGYKPKDVLVGERTDFKIILDGYEELDEVVITGYPSRTISCSTRCSITTVICECYAEGVSIENRKIETESETIKLYPNPSKDGIFTIKFSKGIQDIHFVVADLTGRIILNRSDSKMKSNVVVDLSYQSSGVYIINVSSNGKQIASKKAVVL